MSFGSNDGGSVGGIGGHEGGIGGGGGLGGPGAGDGRSSSGGDRGGLSGYSQADIDAAMAASDAQARQNNAERGLGFAGANSTQIGNRMQALNAMSPQAKRAEQNRIALQNRANDFSKKSPWGMAKDYFQARDMGLENMDYAGLGLGMKAGRGVLGLAAGGVLSPALSALGAKAAGLKGALAGQIAGDEAASSFSEYAMDKAVRDSLLGVDNTFPDDPSDVGGGSDFEKQEIHGILNQITGRTNPKPSQVVQSVPQGPPAPSRLQNFMTPQLPREFRIPARLQQYLG